MTTDKDHDNNNMLSPVTYRKKPCYHQFAHPFILDNFLLLQIQLYNPSIKTSEFSSILKLHRTLKAQAFIWSHLTKILITRITVMLMKSLIGFLQQKQFCNWYLDGFKIGVQTTDTFSTQSIFKYADNKYKNINTTLNGKYHQKDRSISYTESIRR